MTLSHTKKKIPNYILKHNEVIDYRDINILRHFLSSEGKILPSRRSGLNSKYQRKITKAIKRARMISLLPFISSEY